MKSAPITLTLLAILFSNSIRAQLVCDTVWNFDVNNFSPMAYSSAGGFISGHNSLGHISKADKFTNTSAVQITGANFFFGIAQFSSLTSTITAAVWDNSGNGGSPGNIVASKTLLISDIAQHAANGWASDISFTTPANLTGDFYVGITFGNNSGDTVVLMTNEIGSNTPTAWEQWGNGDWYSYSNPASWGIDVAHLIMPSVCYVSSSPCDTLNCNDNDICTNDYCDILGCHSFSGYCSDGNPCTIDDCDAVTGCFNTALNCDDGNPCTIDVCNGGVCINTLDLNCFNPCDTLNCNDSDICTTDTCVAGSCMFSSICPDDGDACTFNSCDSGSCLYTPLVCDDSNLCTTDMCVNGQCEYTPIVFTPEICVVGLDSASGKNIIVWEKPATSIIASYSVYRETNQTNVYAIIGAQAYGTFSTFIDPQSVPEQSSNKYKLGITDVCGQTVEGTNFHKTIHLSINQGVGNSWNLAWNHYEGFAFSTYNIYRGTSSANLALLNSVASNNNSYSDLNPPVGSAIYYQIEVVNPNFCTPTAKTGSYNISRSNIVNAQPTGVEETESSRLKMYPNPFNTSITIELPDLADGPFEFSLFDVTGKKLLNEQHIVTPLFILNSNNLPEGIYYAELRGGRNIYKGKVIVL